MNNIQCGWECAICLEKNIDQFGSKCIYTIIKCEHKFHLGCIQKHFVMKNEIWNDPDECVLQCPLCRSETIKSNWGVRVQIDRSKNQMIIKKGSKQLNLQLSLYGRDLFNRDLKIAKHMLQKIADLCFDVECYWIVAQLCPVEKLNKQYQDDEKKCAKLIQLEEQSIYIERSFGI